MIGAAWMRGLLGRPLVLGLALMVAHLVSAYAQISQGESAYALQNRAFTMKHELLASLGILPLDAYQKGLTGTVAYSYHFSHAWAWEAVHLSYVKNIDTNLQDDLERLFGLEPVARDSLTMIVSSNLVFKPIYRKMLVFGRYVMHGETLFLLGPAAFRFEHATQPAVDLGIAFRLFLKSWLSLRFDARNHTWFGRGMHQVPMFGLGLSFNLGT